MCQEIFRFLDPPRSTEDLGCWSGVTGRFSLVVGYTAFGDFFLLDPSSQQYAVLYTIGPELVPIDFFGAESFRGFLADPGVVNELGRPEKVAALELLCGPLNPDEVYIPVPYPFLGGSGELDTYSRGNVWTFADLVGQCQGVG